MFKMTVREFKFGKEFSLIVSCLIFHVFPVATRRSDSRPVFRSGEILHTHHYYNGHVESHDVLYTSHRPHSGKPTEIEEIIRPYEDPNGVVFCNLFLQKTFEGHVPVLVSPYAAYVSLLKMSYGASGRTERKLQQFLGRPDRSVVANNLDDCHKTFEAYPKNKLTKIDDIFVSKNANVRPEFKKEMLEIFLNAVSEVDTNNPGEATDDINNWVSRNSGGEFSHVLSSGEIATGPGFYMISAMSFKGVWEDGFGSKNDEWFHFDSSRREKVPTLTITDHFVHGFIPDMDADFVTLPFVQGLNLTIFRPRNRDFKLGDVSKIEDKIHVINFYLFSFAQSGEVEVHLPVLKLSSEINLNEILEEMGLDYIFDKKANFDKLSQNGVKLERIAQNLRFEIDEEGLKPEIQRPSSYNKPEVIKVNQPFIFTISYKDVLLFAGRVDNPTS